MKPRRWHRVAIPFAVAIGLMAASWVAHAVDAPDFGDSGTLSPLGTGPDGASRLSALLAERGVPVDRQTTALGTVRAAMSGNATVFVPAPGLTNENLARLIATLPVPNRVVLVEPGRRDQLDLPVLNLGTRWSSRAAAPRCAEPIATAAGAAGVFRSRYAPLDRGAPTDGPADAPQRYTCYSGGLVGTRWGHVELVVVGATDLFRYGRIDEHGNARLAVDLLAAHGRVIWLDRHDKEKVTYSEITTKRLGIRVPRDPGGGGGPPPPAPPSPLWTAVPPTFWPILVQLLLVAVVFALWRARRLGPPVPEPLPVTVPAAETVTGRGRLYERADARGPALDALQTAARHRIQRLLDLPPEAAEADVAAAVAARTGRSPGDVRTVLYGFEPADDDHLLAAVATLDALVTEVTRERTRE